MKKINPASFSSAQVPKASIYSHTLEGKKHETKQEKKKHMEKPAPALPPLSD